MQVQIQLLDARRGGGLYELLPSGSELVAQIEGQSLMRAAMTQLNLSARAYQRILKLAHTIADLTGSEDIQPPHLAEALQYRPKLMVG